jgi:hypothetical protein
LAEHLLLGSQAAGKLDDQLVGEAQGIESLAERLDVTVGLLLLVALVSVEATPVKS